MGWRRTHTEEHLSFRSNWLRAAVLGANDGILSTSSLVLGVAASGASRSAIVTAGIAGLVAGAGSMAAGEYVSVSSQRDTEDADLRLEARELADDPEGELAELTAIYEARGLKSELALEVATELMAHDALEAHARDELGINEITQARPLTAAFASATAFITGGALPLLVAFLAPVKAMVFYQYGFSIIFLAFSGAVAAKAGGSSMGKSILRICIWGTIAMAMSALVGYLFDVQTV